MPVAALDLEKIHDHRGLGAQVAAATAASRLAGQEEPISEAVEAVEALRAGLAGLALLLLLTQTFIQPPQLAVDWYITNQPVLVSAYIGLLLALALLLFKYYGLLRFP
jgi:hypothetical protein